MIPRRLLPYDLHASPVNHYTVYLYSILMIAACLAMMPHALPFSADDFGTDVWRANELGSASDITVASGHAVLDAQLPGGGWPVGALCEILQHHSGQHEWRLILPALVRAELGPVTVLVGAPHVPFGPGLVARGLEADRLVCVTTDVALERLWAAEQALRCADVAAVLAWLPQVRAAQLRRLHMAASQHRKLLFVMRPAQAQDESSPAVLRLLVGPASPGVDALAGALQLHILKRRGPPLTDPLLLPERQASLSVLLAMHSWRAPAPELIPPEARNALDCLAAAA
jgi:protein ImuA